MGEEREIGCSRNGKKFRLRRESATRSSLLSNLLAGYVFRRKIDYGRIGRESQKDSSSFTRERKNRGPALVLISTKERARLINGSNSASICASLEEYNL